MYGQLGRRPGGHDQRARVRCWPGRPGICYATVSMVTNFGAGISPNPLTHEEVLEVMAANGENLKKLLVRHPAADSRAGRGCACGQTTRP